MVFGRRNHGEESKQEAVACFVRTEPARGYLAESPTPDCIHPSSYPFSYPSPKNHGGTVVYKML